MPQTKSYLPQNLALSLRAQGLSQASLAAHLGVEKSAVNKWIKGHVSPSKEHLKKISEHFQLDPKSLLQAHPFDLGAKIGLSRNEIDAAISDNVSTVVLSKDNFVAEEADFLLQSASGIYHTFMPSWVYDGLISCRALEISYFKDSYYFREIHLGYEKMPETEYSGHVGRVGHNIHLIGEETRGIRSEVYTPRELIFASLQVIQVNDETALQGVCLGSDTIGNQKKPVASPYIALLASADCLEDAIPENPYLPPTEIKNTFAVSALRQVKQTWFHSEILWT